MFAGSWDAFFSLSSMLSATARFASGRELLPPRLFQYGAGPAVSHQ